MKTKFTLLALLGLLFASNLYASNLEMICISSDASETHRAVLYNESITVTDNGTEHYMAVFDVDGNELAKAQEILFVITTDAPTVKDDIAAYYVYPNPVQSYLIVMHQSAVVETGRAPSNSPNANTQLINIFDLSGKIIKLPIEDINDSETKIEVASLLPGTYFVQVNDKAIKFIKK